MGVPLVVGGRGVQTVIPPARWGGAESVGLRRPMVRDPQRLNRLCQPSDELVSMKPHQTNHKVTDDNIIHAFIPE